LYFLNKNIFPICVCVRGKFAKFCVHPAWFSNSKEFIPMW
jgi:hypothetical protein